MKDQNPWAESHARATDPSTAKGRMLNFHERIAAAAKQVGNEQLAKDAERHAGRVRDEMREAK